MRISDWSSDVCSSDLLLDEELHYGDGARRRQLPVRGEGEGVDRPAVGVPVDAQHPVDVVRNVGGDLLQRAGEAGELRTAVLLDRRRADRKRVVSGKSVLVRVDLGGRLIIQKKKTHS